MRNWKIETSTRQNWNWLKEDYNNIHINQSRFLMEQE